MMGSQGLSGLYSTGSKTSREKKGRRRIGQIGGEGEGEGGRGGERQKD